MNRVWTVLLALAVIALSCARVESPPARHYELTGRVVAVDRPARLATVAHDEIPGYMAAMTMAFKVREDWALSVLAPGQQIRAKLVVAGLDSWLEEVVITEARVAAAGSPPEGGGEPKRGDPAPDWTLLNQDGRRIGTQDYRGRFLLVTFIYTRCPLPDYCPRMSENFAEILRSVEKEPRLLHGVHLISVSFDPEYDTPKVLRDYARAYLGERGPEAFLTWEFATGSAAEILKIARFFGLSYWREKEQIIHSLRTALIDPGGKLVEIYRGNEWKPADVVAAIGRLLDGAAASGVNPGGQVPK